MIVVHPRAIYNSRQGRIHHNMDELDEVNLINSSVLSDGEREDCIKGRLSTLFKLALGWKKTKDFFYDTEQAQNLKPCKSN